VPPPRTTSASTLTRPNRRSNVTARERSELGLRGGLATLLTAPVYAAAVTRAAVRHPLGYHVTRKGGAASPDVLRTFRTHLVWFVAIATALGVDTVPGNYSSAAPRMWAVVALLACGTPVAAHFLWNSPFLNFFPSSVNSVGDWVRIPFAAAVKGAPLLLFVVVMVRLARRRERMWLETALRSEVETPWLSEVELRVLLDPSARRRTRREMRARAGDAAERLLKRLQKEQVNLAMVRTRVPELIGEALRPAAAGSAAAAPASAGSQEPTATTAEEQAS